MKPEILIFGGTTEGREIAEFCSQHEIPAFVSVFSGYGADMMETDEWSPDTDGTTVRILVGPMKREEIGQFLKEKEIRLVIDATHPYAKNVSDNIRSAVAETSAELVRVLRDAEKAGESDERDEKYRRGNIFVETPEEAAAYLTGTEGNILLTTGSRALSVFAAIPGSSERLYARVLPSEEGIRTCQENGLRGRHIIAMQGPFTVEMNKALLNQTGAEYLVTKESGKNGGYREKLEAAAACGVQAVIIGRPKETGIGLTQCLELLRRRYSVQHVVIAGIGPGNTEHMTAAVIGAILAADRVIGASRMLECAREAVRRFEPGKPDRRNYIAEYRPTEVLRKIREAEGKNVLLLFSGSLAFHSGARACEALLAENGIRYSVLPGISSVTYLSSLLGEDLADAVLSSMHGASRSAEALLDSLFSSGKEYFCILSGKGDDARELAEALVRRGYGTSRVVVGENLSLQNEKITESTAEELCSRPADTRFSALSVIAVSLNKANDK